MSWLLGWANTSWYHSTNPVKLRTKNGSTIPLPDLCKSVTPPCNLNPLLFNGHLQTIYSAIKSRHAPINYKRRLFTADETGLPGSFVVDFVSRSPSPEDDSLPPNTTYFMDEEFEQLASDDTKPMLIALHGISGGSHESYLRHCLEPLIQEGSEWEACAINARGCGYSSITSPIIFNARSTWDLRQTIAFLREMFPNRPLFGIGFSLGANILTNYMGEEGEDCELVAAVLCSNPWNLDVSNAMLQSTWIGLNVYSRSMAKNVMKLFERNVEQISKNEAVDVDKVRREVKYLHDFDRVVQAPSFGYPSQGAYYRDASCVDCLFNIRVPTLAINSQDDPISCNAAIPYEEIELSRYVCLCRTSMGGHLGWFQMNGDSWFVRPATEYLRRIAADFDTQKIMKSPKVKREPLPPKPTQGEYDPLRRRMVFG